MNGWDASPVGHLAVPVISVACSLLIALWYRRRGNDFVGPLAKIVIGSLLAGRIAFILQHTDTYGLDLLAMLDIGDGGFSDTAGLFAALVIGTELTRRTAAARRPLTFAVLSGVLVWVAGTVATLDFAPARLTVPLVQVRRLDGIPVQLRTFTRKPMVINLWATWCPPCRREMPVLRNAQRGHPDISFVFLNQGESTVAIQRFLLEQGLNLDNVFSDPTGEVARRMTAFAYPTTLFFDGDGMLFIRQVGELTQTGLDERLAMLHRSHLRETHAR